jgi:nucleotide-binding universal stress UspA family protein
MFEVRKILVPVDFSEPSKAAFDHAMMIAERVGANVDVLHVFSLPALASTGDILVALPDQPYENLSSWAKREAEKALDELIGGKRGRGAVAIGRRLEMGRAEETILSTLETGDYDLVVMGTHGRSGLSHLLMGSVAERVVRLSPQPVLTVKG